RAALRSRNVNVSITTATEVWNRTPSPTNRSQLSRARGCSGSRVSARAIQAPVSTKTLSPARTSALVVDAVVVDRRASWLAVPEGDRPAGARPQPDAPDGFAHQIRHAAPGPLGGLVQRLEFLAPEVHLRLDHMCQ